MCAVDDASPDVPRFLHGIVCAFEFVVTVGVELERFARRFGMRAMTADKADVDITVASLRRRVCRHWLQLQLGQDVDVEAFVFEDAPWSRFVGHGVLPHIYLLSVIKRYSLFRFESTRGLAVCGKRVALRFATLRGRRIAAKTGLSSMPRGYSPRFPFKR
jgi:hypothetical protein